MLTAQLELLDQEGLGGAGEEDERSKRAHCSIEVDAGPDKYGSAEGERDEGERSKREDRLRG